MARVFPAMTMRLPPESATILLVYNADAGLLNAARESLMKVFAPARLECSLCALTHGLFTMHGDWRLFLNSLPVGSEEYHRDDFAAGFPGHAFELPAVLIVVGNKEPQVMIGAGELDAMEGLDELIERVQDRLVDVLSRSPGMRLAD